MRIEDFPAEIRSDLIPKPSGDIRYRCLGCNAHHGIESLLYTCPQCGHVLLLEDRDADRLRKVPGERWRRIFDYRKMLTVPALRGIYRYHEFLGPVIPIEDIVYLGEGQTPMIAAAEGLQRAVGIDFYFKNDGQNPSASFKDRGMASALSYIHHRVKSGEVSNVLAICASTGDTSAAAALYGAYLHPAVKTAVLLPHGKVTPQQLSQPLGSGAAVFEIPGVFDDCMKVVEELSEHYNVALLNSKNAWRILGQESYAYEIAQDFEYDLSGKVVVAPIGNAGNITAILSGFIKFYTFGIIADLPKIVGVQSRHADPVYRYYCQPDPDRRRFEPVTVQPSVAQAAMIGNPVSMPRVIELVERYNRLSGGSNVFVVQVEEQDIMDWQLQANRNGHIACTHGGESLAGLRVALRTGLVKASETAVLDSTAHALKFAGFQGMYFEDRFPTEFHVVPDRRLINAPVLIRPADLEQMPAPGKPLEAEAFRRFVHRVSGEIAARLGLEPLESSPPEES